MASDFSLNRVHLASSTTSICFGVSPARSTLSELAMISKAVPFK
ncbi:Uncharacterised protein [Vibrio cholerae]|nr:Uncharacterised protein [Vibrio cholerae]